MIFILDNERTVITTFDDLGLVENLVRNLHPYFVPIRDQSRLHHFEYQSELITGSIYYLDRATIAKIIVRYPEKIIHLEE